MQIWAESGKSALPICNYSQILYQFLTFTQNLKRSRLVSRMEQNGHVTCWPCEDGRNKYVKLTPIRTLLGSV